VKIELHDWRVAQVAALMDGYFSTMGLVFDKKIILSTQKYAQIAALRSGRGTEEQRNRNVKMAAKKMFEEYSVLAFKGPDDPFGSASEAQSFDEARACIASCYHLYALAESERRFGPEILYQCSCPQFWHYGKCKHVLGYAIYKKQIKVPAIYAIEKIGVNRKPGRPSKANGGDALRRI